MSNLQLSTSEIETLKNLKFEHYINSKPIVSISGFDFNMRDVTLACLLSRLNIGLLGDTGMGKTQLMKDLLSWFGNDGLYVLGRNDLDVKQLYRTFNLGKLQHVKTSAEISELTANVKLPIVAMDELTRCIEAVQNQLFNVFDGYIELDGKRYDLGKPFGDLLYSVGIAAANYGNGKFTGASSIDRAFLDRLYMIIDVDNFAPSATDTIGIFLKNHDPRTKDSSSNDAFDTIAKVWQNSLLLTPNAKRLLAVSYFIHGLDYVPGFDKVGNSKRAIKTFPSAVENFDGDAGIKNYHKDNFSSLIFPMSIRAGKSVMALCNGLETVLKLKDKEAKVNDFELTVESFKLVGAYSGILMNERKLKEDYYGNNWIAMKEIGETVKTRLEENEEKALIAIGIAEMRGTLEEKVLGELGDDFHFVKDMCQEIVAQKNV